MSRIIISPTQFKVSKPGTNVATATGDNIVFDAFNVPRYNGVLISGIVYGSAGWPSDQIGNVFLGQVQHTRRYRTISLAGRTFSSQPQALLAMRPAGDTGWGAAPKYAHVQTQTNGLVGSCVTASCSSTELRIYVDSPTFGTGSGNVNWDVAYVVFQT
jgi:hypothetical protein